jgi:lipopolysaccharide export system protein LptA
VQYRHIRITRVLVAVAIVVIFAVTGASYLWHVSRLKAARPKAPDLLPSNVENATVGFNYTKIEAGQPVFSVKASRNLGLKGNKNILEDVEVLVHGRTGDRYDRIHSARADYDEEAGTVLFVGDVAILLSSRRQEAEASLLPDNDPRKSLLDKTLIKTSKMTYSQRSNLVNTDAPVQFTFNDLSGDAIGMFYETTQDQLQLKRDVRMKLARADGTPPIEITSSSLNFQKNPHEISFAAPVQVKRGDYTLAAQYLVVRLDADNHAQQAVAVGNPSVTSRAPTMQLSLTSDSITANMRDGGKSLDTIVAVGNVHAETHSTSSSTEFTGQQLTASFVSDRNVLHQLTGDNNVVLKILPPKESVRTAGPSTPATAAVSLSKSDEVRILRTSHVEVFMRPGGHDFERLVCPGLSTLELIPPVTTQDRRIVRGDRFDGTFAGAKNALETFTATGHVKVDLEPATPQPSSTHRQTQSDALVARFDPSSGLLTRIDQTGNFEYFETDLHLPEAARNANPIRRASAARAHYSPTEKVTVLEGQPQVWDATSKTSARSMTMEEQSDRMTAAGNVLTVYQNKKSSPSAFSGSDAPVFISSDRLVGHSHAKTATYTGSARMWQEDDVIKSDEIQLDQQAKTMLAVRGVSSTFLVQEEGSAKKNFVSINADSLKYEDGKHQARYEKNVVMRGEMGVLHSPLLDVFLVENPKPKESRIDRALAQGGVTIVQPQRRANSERAEFFARENKVVLTGNHPTIIDEEKGASTGRQLTFFPRDDRILIDGDSQTRTTTQHKVARK